MKSSHQTGGVPKWASWAAIVALLIASGASLWFRFRSPSVPAESQDVSLHQAAPELFSRMTDHEGLFGFHQVGRFGQYFFPDIMAPGAALFDYDRDGDLDVLLANSTTDTGGDDGPRLFRQDATWEFSDVTEESGLVSEEYGMGLAVGDVNNDGYPDVFFTCFGSDQLFLNRQDGTFLDITTTAGIDNRLWGASACFFDYDRDGWLDLLVTNYVDYYPSKRCEDGRGYEDYCGPQVFLGTSDRLYHNAGGLNPAEATEEVGPTVRFEDVSLKSGIARQHGPGLGVVSADFNQDSWPDLYVANDGAANFLWINQQDGSFQDLAVLQGAANDALGRSEAGMGIAIGDLNADARFDLFVTHLDGETNTLYLSDSLGFHDAGRSAGLSAPSLPLTGFGTALADLDHDGDLDAIVVNGRVKRRGLTDSASGDAHLPGNGFWQPYAEPNQIFFNHDGRFEEYQSADDPFLSAKDVSRGLAIGDIDNDGDLDLLVSNTGGAARLYRNDMTKAGHWLMVDAVDPQRGGRSVEGAVVIVTAGKRQWRRLVHTSSSYLSSHDPRVHFGVGPAETVDRIEVQWPDGGSEVFAGGVADVLRVIRRGEGHSL